MKMHAVRESATILMPRDLHLRQKKMQTIMYSLIYKQHNLVWWRNCLHSVNLDDFIILDLIDFCWKANCDIFSKINKTWLGPFITWVQTIPGLILLLSRYISLFQGNKLITSFTFQNILVLNSEYPEQKEMHALISPSGFLINEIHSPSLITFDA